MRKWLEALLAWFYTHRRARIGVAVGFLVILGILTLILVASIVRQAGHQNESPTPKAANEQAEKPAPTSVPYKIEVVTGGLFVPWSIVPTDDDRLLVSERSGEVRIIEGGTLLDNSLTRFDEVVTGGEEGLMGLAKDPAYNQNKFLYACLAYQSASGMKDKVVRFEDTTGGGQRTTLLDNIPAAQYHAGCRLAFGPDGKLYITTGDATQKAIAQDLNSLGGKILRINSDGSVPSDNPFGSPIWSYGHRNPQGPDWQPGTGALLATEHGPSGFDGPGGGDELNFIEKGGNYGWPLVSHKQTQEGTIAPFLTFTPAVAPSGAHFYRSSTLPQFTGNYLFAMLRGEGLYRIAFDASDTKKIQKQEKMSDIDVGRVRDVTEGPDGTIYFATSNRDGRGSPRSGDDKIYRIIPQP